MLRDSVEKKIFLFTGRSGCVFKLKTEEKKKGKKGEEG